MCVGGGGGKNCVKTNSLMLVFIYVCVYICVCVCVSKLGQSNILFFNCPLCDYLSHAYNKILAKVQAVPILDISVL